MSDGTTWWVVLAFACGALLGGGIALVLALRGRVRRAEREAQAAAELAELRAALAAKGADVSRLVTERDSERAEARAEAQELRREVLRLREGGARLSATLEGERKAHEEKLEALAAAEVRLRETFEALAAQALRQNSQSFGAIAEQREKAIDALVKPVQEKLAQVEGTLQGLEKERAAANAELRKHLELVAQAQEGLRSETGNLVKALRQPHVRGRWGEVQLRRVVELAQMVPHCDFEEQTTVDTDDGKLRPDARIRLPGGKSVIIDAKAPMAAYLEALETQDEAVREQKLREHALQLRAHIQKLSAKAYWDQFQPSPEFVVLFLPAESFFSTALQQDPTLLETGVEHRVLPASPLTLIALLRAVAYGWRQERIAENAEQMRQLGADLHGRVRKLAEHVLKLGRSLNGAVESYNAAVGSLESRVLVAARRFGELGAISEGSELPEVGPLESRVRELQALPPAETPSLDAPKTST